MAESALFARYELLCELAAGGMATVHLGRRVGAAGFHRLVVIKRVHRHLVESEGARAMFVDEARISSHIHHPNVVPVVDVFDEGGELALVMDYVESVSLASLLTAARAKGERLPVNVVSRILGEALLGLHAAHEAVGPDGASLAVVHRDVSPQNIIVGTDGTTRLIDFGIATAEERLSVTKDNSLKGKLRYMSPEQARREPLDRRSDVFAAALVLYEALTGQQAFKGHDEATIWISLVLGEIDTTADVPENLKVVLGRALERNPEDRVPTALALEEMLRSAITPAAPSEVIACVERYLGPKVRATRETLRSAQREPSQAILDRSTPGLTTTRTLDGALEAQSPKRRRSAFIGIGAASAIVLFVFVGVTRARTAATAPSPAQVPTAAPAAPSAPAALAAPTASPRASSAPEPSAAPTSPRAERAPAASVKPVRQLPQKAKARTHGPSLHDNPYGMPR